MHGRRDVFMWQQLARRLVPALILVMTVGYGIGLSGSAQEPVTRDITLVDIEYEGSKIWVPGPVVVKKGDTVKIKASNNIKSEPLVHGLAIEAFGIQEVVNEGQPVTIEFKADKAGIFPIKCHLHPAHVGTQLVVLE
jgi:nitrosocyanin